MACNNCGYMSSPGVRFCGLCGAGLYEESYPQDTNEIAYMPENTLPDTSKNRKAKRAVKAAIGILILTAAALVYVLVFAGTPVTGNWYSEVTNTAFIFSDDSLSIYSLSGIEEAEYQYNKLRGEGTILLEQSAAFKVDKDKLVYRSGEGEESFIRAKSDFDAEEFVKRALYGDWSNIELAEAVEIREDGTVSLYSINGEHKTGYVYDTAKGEGVFNNKNDESIFTASAEQLEIKGVGTFVKENEGFDIEAFIEKYGNPLKGTWYDAAGSIGRFDFLDGGAVTLLSYGTIYEGSYVFDNKEDFGSLRAAGKAFDIRIEGGTLDIGAWKFTREPAPQKGREDVYEQLVGVWYDTAGKSGTLEFLQDGTAIIKTQGASESGACAFNPIAGNGTIAADITKQCAQRAFNLSNGKLILGDTIYVRSFVEQADSPIEGIWYHDNGTMGIIQFLSGGKAELEIAGGKYTGTYTFDKASGQGKVSTLFNNRQWSFNIRLEGDSLVIETGMFIAGDVVYTRNIAEKPQD